MIQSLSSLLPGQRLRLCKNIFLFDHPPGMGETPDSFRVECGETVSVVKVSPVENAVFPIFVRTDEGAGSDGFCVAEDEVIPWEYEGMALPEGHYRSVLGALLLLNLVSGARKYGVRLNERQRKNCWIDADYCIDAPNEMPAGGCYQTSVADIADDADEDAEVTHKAWAAQITFDRPCRYDY